MGVTNYLLIADVSEAETVAAHEDPSRDWEGMNFQGLDIIKLVTLWSHIDAGSSNHQFEQRMDAVLRVASGDAGPFVEIAPPKMVSALAQVAEMNDDQISHIAESLSRLEDFSGWNPGDVVNLVRSVGNHAEMAATLGRSLLVYTSL